MNLKAKGFFLDNADEMCKLEFREIEEKRDKVKELYRKQNDLLSLMDGDDEQLAFQATEELRQLT
jgi:hypothetical protein